MASDPDLAPTPAAADRRGRRASWIALGLTLVLIAIAFTTLDDWYHRERYLRLREHRMRENRFALETLAEERGVLRRGSSALLVTIDGLADVERELAAAARPSAVPTLDSLRALATPIRIGSLEAEDAAASLAGIIAVSVADRAVRRVAVMGAPIQPDATWVEAFDLVRGDCPRVTGWLDEGEATWVSLEAGRELLAAPDEATFLWLRYTELAPPALPHDRFPRGNGQASELAAVDHYLGQLLRARRASAGEDPGPIVVVGSGGAEGFLDGILVGSPTGDHEPPAGSLSPGQLAEMIATAISPRIRTPRQ